MLKPVLLKPSAQREVHCAQWIVADADTVIENGSIEVENGLIKGVYEYRPEGKMVDHGSGVLMPPLVNCHLHLELSALKNKIDFGKGFRAWVKTLLEKREALGEKKLIEGARLAIEEVAASGTQYIGDVSTLNITESLLKKSNLSGICFNEYLGTQVEEIDPSKEKRISSSLAGHAPHTTSPELLKALKKKTLKSGRPFSIHLAESEDESEFIRDKKGPWADFLISRGIDFSNWNVGGKTPVEYIYDMGILDPFTIAVHALNVTRKDIEILSHTKTKVCVCPRSNLNLHNALPDIASMIGYGVSPGLGTDSLASCDSLSMFDEMAFVKKNYPDLSCETIFSMGTINGAKTLGMAGETGTLSKGKKAMFLYLPVEAKNTKDVFRKIITNE